MNKVSFTKVQTEDRTTNQLQNNISGTLQQVGNLLSNVTIIGELKMSRLSLEQFVAQAGKGWVLCDGQSVVGSQYNKISGNLVAPTISSMSGANFFLRIN